MNKLLALILLALAISSSPAAVFTGEQLNQPFVVHGRLAEYNGAAVLCIWIVGSKRMLEVTVGSPALVKLHNLYGVGNGSFDQDVFADFTIEPLAPDVQGHMRPVRILDAKHLVVTRKGNIIAKKGTL